jgi:hypothetical protein
MAQPQATTTPAPSANGKREVKPLTAIDAISKIEKILVQLSPTDRKRVLAFVNESSTSEG